MILNLSNFKKFTNELVKLYLYFEYHRFSILIVAKKCLRLAFSLFTRVQQLRVLYVTPISDQVLPYKFDSHRYLKKTTVVTTRQRILGEFN